jgi:radical SAM protein with 4Fe4S-binding SPASM domain
VGKGYDFDMKSQCADTVNFGFSKEEIAQAVRSGRLLSMEIEFSLRCDFRCPYCYVPNGRSHENELSPEEIRHTIVQAKDLGARRIIILGGEPSIYPGIVDMIGFIRKQGLEVEMFTNGSGITPTFAEQLIQQNVRVVLKLNTRNEKLQDRLAGKTGASRIIHAALTNLKRAGYPSEAGFLAISTVICRQNLDEVPEMWQWLRDQNIEPYFEMITPQENAKRNTWLDVTPLELAEVFAQLASIDRALYGRSWEPQPPLAANRCLRHQFSCLVTSKGDVMPCVGVTIPVGNVRERSLSNIIQTSQVLQDLRNYRHTIKGPCRTCEKAVECYGCRGAAFQLTGDYLASDPMCWRNAVRQP